VRGRPEGGRRAAPVPSGYLERLLPIGLLTGGCVTPAPPGGARTGGLDAGAGIARCIASNQMPAITA
jgi:hypothetical protein